jgi:hypothetical protein
MSVREHELLTPYGINNIEEESGMNKLASWLTVCVLTGTLLGCGGGGAGSTPTGTVNGVATPAAVSVVTAK